MTFPFEDKNKLNSSDSGWRFEYGLNYHFMGVGGVAMGNVAVDLAKSGYNVTGSDAAVYSPMKEFLEQSGIRPMTPYSPDNLIGKDVIIVGNAISRGNPELEAMLNNRMIYTSMSEFIRWGLLTGRKNLVVTGTHGKTTCTTLLSHVLSELGTSPGYMIGGVPLNLSSGFSSGKGEYFAIEGDEYDIAFFDKRAKFLQYLPYAVIINNIQFDHGDIYNNLGEIQDAFRKLVRIIPENGYLIYNGDDENIRTVLSEMRCNPVTFGLESNCNFTAKYISGEIQVVKNGSKWGSFAFTPPGKFNMMNALGVVSLLDSLGMDKTSVIGALENFRGVKRRMELVGEAGGITIYDDFAHHPTAVKASLTALKEKYPDSRIWGIFQPRSNTSVTNVFQDEWADAFSAADLAVIADLHRKEKIPVENRLSREKIKSDLSQKGVEAFLWKNEDEILSEIDSYLKPGDIVLTMSNADFGGLPYRIKTMIEKQP